MSKITDIKHRRLQAAQQKALALMKAQGPKDAAIHAGRKGDKVFISWGRSATEVKFGPAEARMLAKMLIETADDIDGIGSPPPAPGEAA